MTQTEKSLEQIVKSLDELTKLYQDDLKQRTDIDKQREKQTTADVKAVLTALELVHKKLETS